MQETHSTQKYTRLRLAFWFPVTKHAKKDDVSNKEK